MAKQLLLLPSTTVLVSILCICAPWRFGVAQAQDTTTSDGRPAKKIQEMKVEAPIMTEEDQYGYNMPERYACDACKAVAYHLNETLTRRQPKSRRLKQWEYTELLDEACATEFKGYGIKMVDGENRLSGPALKQEDTLPMGGAMIQFGGENWEKRMGEICRKFVYDKVGEEELYETFRTQGELRDSMCLDVTGDCKKKKSAPKKTSSSASAKTKDTKATTGKSEKANSKKGLKMEPTAKANKGAEKTSTATAGKKDPEKALDVTFFLSQLAVEHGLHPRDYTKSRSKEEWEKTFVKLAGTIFAKSAEGMKAEETVLHV